MAKEGSVAPKERVNIVYKPATSGQPNNITCGPPDVSPAP